MKHLPAVPYGYLRVIHAIPCPHSYDCYLDEKIYAKDLLFEDYTTYLPIPSGEHQLTLCKHKETENLLTHSFWISPSKIYTLLLTIEPYTDQIGYYLLNDPVKKIPEDQLLLRFSPFAELDFPFELHLDDIKPIFKKLKLGKPSPYLAFSPGTYNLQLHNTDTQEIVLLKEKCLLKPSRRYTLYLLGGTKSFPLRLSLTIDGSSFLSFPEGNK